ncbi:MerR family transcriptional regulator [Roseovarius bejariae]|uniref:MerR family transcriptional regulator n=1 Tax=Roseovarius bejariae TaxID=2576383 RepID=UPI001FEC6726|nr:MerR family transcriptional regulator [Roseovarius bejariae]
MPKSADAFRTISEVADWLETPAHVLRFWESKFSQVKPVKRAGGRRYYRPADMLLLGGIKKLLHDDGMTIKGVQKVLREHGVKHVAAMSQPLDEDTEPEDSGITLDAQPAEPSSATIVDFKSSSGGKPAPDTNDEPTESAPVEAEDVLVNATSDTPPDEAPDTLAAETEDSLLDDDGADSAPLAPSQAPDTLAGGAPDGVEDTVRDALSGTGAHDTDAPEGEEPAPQDDDTSPVPAMPSFQHQRADVDESTSHADDTADTQTTETSPPPPAPAQIKVPEDPEDGLSAAPGLLSRLLDHHGPLDPATAKKLAPLVDRLRALQSGTSAQG